MGAPAVWAAGVAGGIVGAAELLEDAGGPSELIQVGAIGAAMFLGYRITTKAHADSVALYQASARDAQERLTQERAAWAADEQDLRDELARLRAEVAAFRVATTTTKKEEHTDEPHP